MRSLIVLALLMLQPVAAYADASANLNRLLSAMESFSADFEQLVLDNTGANLQASQGHVDLQRPGLFRWETAEPFPQLLVSDGQWLWLYDQDLEQVTQQSVDKRLTNTPALLLSGDLETLQSSFSVAGPAEGDEGLFRLTPLNENAMFVVMRIRFVDGIPIEMQLEDNLGQQTSLLFRNRRFNPPLDPALFRFEVPEGVDLIQETPDP